MIITVASFKGGVGKTTTAIHLAAFLQGYAPTLLIDADPNRSALLWASRGNLPFPVVNEWGAEGYGDRATHVVIDTPARPNPEDLALLVSSCDLLILPTTPDTLALDALALMVDYLSQMQWVNYKILLTVTPPHPSQAGPAVRAMLENIPLPLFKGGIRRYAAYQKAAQMGKIVYEVKDPKAETAWTDYGAVGQELLHP